jgi:phosphatidylethanolamine-binding protein (PEBP) family uncharacterized protein
MMLTSTHVGRQTLTSAQKQPTFYINGHPDKLYALVMLDHDAPSPNSPWLHMLYINIPGSAHHTTPSNPKQITSYSVGETTKTGRHHYITTLYEQPFSIQGQNTIGDWGRPHFNIKGFITKYGLKPVGETGFFIDSASGSTSASAGPRKRQDRLLEVDGSRRYKTHH